MYQRRGNDRENNFMQLRIKWLYSVRYDVTSGGRPFHVLAVAMGNTRSPMVRSRVTGTVSVEVENERFWNTAISWFKIASFSYPSHSATRLPMFPLEFGGEVNHEETSHGAIIQWRPHDRRVSDLTQYQRVTDGRIDGQTDGQTDGFTIVTTARPTYSAAMQ